MEKMTYEMCVEHLNRIKNDVDHLSADELDLNSWRVSIIEAHLEEHKDAEFPGVALFKSIEASMDAEADAAEAAGDDELADEIERKYCAMLETVCQGFNRRYV